MKYKFYNPLGNEFQYRITQTFHGENASNPSDVSKQIAIDISANGGDRCYAVADGVLTNVYKHMGDSYFVLDIGMPWKVFYVHATCNKRKGDKVTLGEDIGVVYAMEYSHLHFGFKNKDGKPPKYNPMQYFDRASRWYATHPDIINLWCTPDGNVDWSLFEDYYLGTESDVEMPNVVKGDLLQPIVEKIRFRKSYGLDGEIIRELELSDVLTVQSEQFPIDDGYSWMDVRVGNDRGWVAYQSDWYTKPASPEVPTPCEKYLKEIEQLKETIDDLETDNAYLNRVIQNVSTELVRLEKEQSETGESNRSYDTLAKEFKVLKENNQTLGRVNKKLSTDVVSQMKVIEKLRESDVLYNQIIGELNEKINKLETTKQKKVKKKPKKKLSSKVSGLLDILKIFRKSE